MGDSMNGIVELNKSEISVVSAASLEDSLYEFFDDISAVKQFIAGIAVASFVVIVIAGGSRMYRSIKKFFVDC